MFHELLNQPRPYAWGDSFSIAHWQGRTPSGQPEAELWWGTHPGSEAQVLLETGQSVSLSSWLGENNKPVELPFLVKLLAADKPLSIQVHPSKAQAESGFAKENLRGTALDSPSRNYRDDSDKPEIMIAWSEEFHALVGFQNPENAAHTLATIQQALSNPVITAPLEQAVAGGSGSLASWLFSGEREVVDLAVALEHAWSTNGSFSESAPEVWRRVASHYPGDPGLLAALFLNHVILKRGQALFVPAGIPHAYLEGFGLEVMAPSDNVLRGGLTPKHVDRAELLAILHTDPVDQAVVKQLAIVPQGERFAPAGVSFEVMRFSGNDLVIPILSARAVVVVVESGEFHSGDELDPALVAGKAYIGLGSENPPSLTGSGSVFVVSGI
jgi:mannose-6-phosphate isomerase